MPPSASRAAGPPLVPSGRAADPPPAPSARAVRWDRALTLAAFAAIVLLFTCGALRCIWGADFWWQHRTGRLVATSGPPSVDVFSYTSAGNTWIETRWLYCWILYRAIAAGGFAAAVLWKWALGAAAYALVTAIAVTRRTALPACALLFVALLASSQRLFVRPEMVSHFFTAYFLWAIMRFRTSGSRAVWTLPVAAAVWANMHSLSILGVIMAATLAAVSLVEWVDRRKSPDEAGRAEDKRRAAIAGVVFAGTVLALFATPYLVRGPSLQLEQLTEIHGTIFKDMIVELRSPFTFAQSYTAIIWWEVLVGLTLLSALVNLRRLEPFLTLATLGQLYLSATSIRNIPLFALAAIPFVLWNLRESPWMARVFDSRLFPSVGRALGAAVIVLAAVTSLDLVTDRFNVRQNDTNQFGTGLARHTFAERAVGFLRDHGLEGPVFNTMYEGAYLVENDVEVFIDPRLEVYGEAWFRRYFRMQDEQGVWNEEARARGFRTMLVDVSSPFVVRALTQGGWELVHFDEVAVVLARRDHLGTATPIVTVQDYAAAAERLRAWLPRPVPASGSRFARVATPVPYLRVANFLLTVNHPELAETFAVDAIAAWPSVSGAHEILGKLRSARGDREGAIAEFEAELRSKPVYPLPVERLLAFEYFAVGRTADARRALEKLTADLPTDAFAWAALTKLQSEGGDGADALRSAERAVALAPRVPEYRKNLGRSQALAGQRAAAIATLEKAFRIDPRDASVAEDIATLTRTIDAEKSRRYREIFNTLRGGT